MSIAEYIGKMKSIQDILLEYFDSEGIVNEDIINLTDKFKDINITENKHEFKSMLHLLAKIINNHYRSINFFSKIEQLIFLFKDKISEIFSNSEIFDIFKRNKRILLFLMNEKIITIDRYIVNEMENDKYMNYFYLEYFYPEIELFLSEKMKQKIKENIDISAIENFEEKRKNGENDSYICQLIQNDNVENFIAYINKNNIQINSEIKPSIFETNTFLLKRFKDTSLIEYSVFCGSIQIFQYLLLNNAKIFSTNWFYAIHGKNAEIIHLIEENHIDPPNKDCYPVTESFTECLIESIKCHHNDIADYFFNFFNNDKSYYCDCFKLNILRCYNFAFIQADKINESIFYYLCKYDYFILVENILKNSNVDINEMIIYEYSFNEISYYYLNYI